MAMAYRPRLLLTMGDVAGIGPEIIARAWPELHALCQPVVVGDASWMRQSLSLMHTAADIRVVADPAEANPGPAVVPLVQGSGVKLDTITAGKVSRHLPRARLLSISFAVQFMTIRWPAAALPEIVTALLHKGRSPRRGRAHRRHTEILAERYRHTAIWDDALRSGPKAAAWYWVSCM